MKRQQSLHAQIKRILERAPADLWVAAETTGELLPTLNLYLYIANELGIEYSVRTYPLGDLWQAVATLQHNGRTNADHARGRGAGGEGNPPLPLGEEQGVRVDSDPDPTHLSQLQSRALLKAFRLYLYPHIKACQPNARTILLATAHILYRERGYNRNQRLQHATHILGKPVPIQSFTELTNADLAELIVALNLTDPSSQYE